MQNPPQIIYTTEELFMLKPEIRQAPSIKAPIEVATVSNQYASMISVNQFKNLSFWDKSKWYFIIGGIVLIGGSAWVVYQQKKRNKKSPTK